MARVELSPMFGSLSGKLGGVIVRNRGGRIVFAEIPRRPYGGYMATPHQRRIRNRFAAAVKEWRGLSRSEMDSWRVYANRFFRDCPDRPAAPSGYNVFTGAACLNLAAGREIARIAPPTAPPAPVHAVRLAAFEEGHTLEFEIGHWQGVTEDHVLYLQVTPPGLPGLMFHDRDLRGICGTSAESYLPLEETPQLLRFENLEREYTPDSELLVRAVIANREGVASLPFTATAAFGEDARVRT